MNKNNQIRTIIRRAYDLHVHIGPEIIPRKFTVSSLVSSERGKIAAMVLKNHFYPTTPFIAESRINSPKLFGSVVLNNFAGGLNAEAIYATSLLTKKRFIVWFPTTSAKQFLDKSTWEIAPEWVNQKDFRTRRAKNVSPIRIIDSRGELIQDCLPILYAIKNADAVLATGHISWQESVSLVKRARKIGINKIIVTHPIYQRIAMPLTVQKNIARLGAKIEVCWSMWKIDKISLMKIVQQIRSVGPKNIIISSDTGQLFSPPPNQALYDFAAELFTRNITIQELDLMLVQNPKGIIDL